MGRAADRTSGVALEGLTTHAAVSGSDRTPSRSELVRGAVAALTQAATCAVIVTLAAWSLVHLDLLTPLVEVLIHTGTESASVVVCALAFVATWSVERRNTPVNASTAGTLLLGAGLLDLFHAVSYVTVASSLSGLVESESRLFSAGSRIALAGALFCYAWLPGHPMAERNRWYVLFAVLAATAAVAGSATMLAGAFPQLIPSEAIADRLSRSPGLVVVVLLVLTAGRFLVAHRRADEEKDVTLVAACVLFAVRELITLYGANEIEALPRLIAHGIEVTGCVLLYRGLVVRRLRRPEETATRLRTALRITEAQLLRAQTIAAFTTYRLVGGEGIDGERLFGADAARLIGLDGAMRLPEAEFRARHVHPDDRSALTSADRQLATVGKSTSEYRVVLPGGSERVMRDVAERLGDAGAGMEVLGVLHDVTENRRIEDELRRLAAHVESTREAERIRIAREIHDELGGLLTGIRMQIAMSMRDRPDGTSVAVPPASTLQLIDSATEALRRVIRDLRPSILDDLGPVAAIEWYADERLRKAGVRVDVAIGAGVTELAVAGERASAIFRVTQEALTNIARHAEATHVDIALTLETGRLVIRIRDDGRGMQPEAPAVADSWGLRGMRERLRFFGGELHIDSAPGHGTAVTVVMPLGMTDG